MSKLQFLKYIKRKQCKALKLKKKSDNLLFLIQRYDHVSPAYFNVVYLECINFIRIELSKVELNQLLTLPFSVCVGI